MNINWFKIFQWSSVIMFVLCVVCGAGLILYAGVALDTHEKIEVEKGTQRAVIGLLFLFISIVILNNIRIFNLKKKLRDR